MTEHHQTHNIQHSSKNNYERCYNARFSEWIILCLASIQEMPNFILHFSFKIPFVTCSEMFHSSNSIQNSVAANYSLTTFWSLKRQSDENGNQMLVLI